jgi:ABC-type lipoprotein release transport system permease subunit
MYKLFIAFRYMRRNWLNLLGIFAVWMVVTAMICVLSVMKAFDVEFRDRIRATLSDLIVEPWPSLSPTFGNYDEIMAKIESIPHVTACAPQFDGIGLARLAGQSRFCEFHGIDLQRELRTTDFLDYWQTWRARAAEEELRPLFAAQDDASLPDPKTEQVRPLLEQMREKDFNRLDSATREAIRSWAARNKVALDTCVQQAGSAYPSWGDVAEANTSPAFVGGAMLILGKDMNDNPVSIGPGKNFVLISLPPGTTGISDERLLRNCRIVGAFHSGMSEYDSGTIYLPLEDVQKLMGRPGEITGISIKLDSFDYAEEVRAAILGILTPDELDSGIGLIAPRLRKLNPGGLKRMQAQSKLLRERVAGWFAEGNPNAVSVTYQLETDILIGIRDVLRAGIDADGNAFSSKELLAFQELAIRREKELVSREFQISTWEDKRRSFLRAVWLERRIMGVILLFVSAIAGFLVLAILHTTVLTKTKDIGILKSIGGSVRGILSIFMLNGLLIGVAGSALGTVSALLITRKINEIEAFIARWTGFTLWPPDIYYLDRIPVDQHPGPTILVICATIILMSLVGSAYPAIKAARMDAVEALRYE